MHLTHQSDSKSIATKDRRDKATNEGVSLPSRTIVHAKLEMTSPQDAEELEADAVANEIVSGGKIRRKMSQRGSGSSGIAVSSQMESQLSRLQGGGQQMPSGLQSMMEKGFGRDLSQVRLHTDSDAATMSSSIHAKAFTHGNDIYFNHGQYSPETTKGQKLVAHEVTHVVQGNGKVGRELIFDGSGMPLIDSERKSIKGLFANNIKLVDSLNYFLSIEKPSFDSSGKETVNEEQDINNKKHEKENTIRKDMEKVLIVVNGCIQQYLNNSINKDIFNKYFNQSGDINKVIKIFKKIKKVIDEENIYFFYSRYNPTGSLGYVFQTDGRYAIALSEGFFKESEYGRVNILVHELAHEVDKNIIDVLMPGSNDIIAYGRDNVEKLANNHSNLAIQNASNYGFFAEEYLKIILKSKK